MMPCPFSYPAGFMTVPVEAPTLLRMNSGFHPNSATFLIDWAANLGVVMLTKISAPFDFRVTIDESTVGSVVSYDCSPTIIDAALAPQSILETFDIIFAVVIVLIEDSDLSARLFLQDVFCIDASFALIIGLPSHRPREILLV